ncbi:MAG TPA: oligosaccharide flippase family protein [Candidatus Binatia bacterium]|nr:oligosaccharide flippase family protein [Candidatus Binatia bacterium]
MSEERAFAGVPLVVWNAVAMLAARLAPPVFSFAINVAIARLYGAGALGSYVWVLSLLVIFQTVAGAGMTLLVTREIAARPGDAAALVVQARTIGVATGLGATALFLVIAFFSSDATSALAAAALAPSLLPSAWIAVQEAYFVAHRRHHAVTAVAIAENAVKLALAALALAAGGGLVGVCGAITAARVVALAFGQRLMARAGCRPGWRLAIRDSAPLARALPPFGAMLVVAMLFFRVDVLVVGLLRGEHDTGVYGAAVTLYTVALLLPDSAMSAVFPRLAASFQSGRAGAATATLLTAKLLAIALVPVAVALIDLADPVLHLVYGARFADAAPALRMLAASLPVHAVNAAFGQALQAGGHQRAILAVAVLGTALHAVVTCALVALLGIEGAPIAVLFSSSVVAVLGAAVFHLRVAPIRIGLRSVCAVSAVAGPVALALLAPARLELAATVAGAVWLACALGARQVLGSDEIAEMARVLRPGRMEARA